MNPHTNSFNVSDEVRKKVEDSINRSGYPLELYVTKLISKKYPVWNNQYFFDYDEKKARSVDMYVPAIDVFTSPHVDYLSIDMVIECKKSISSAWVFFPIKNFVQSQYSGQIVDHHHIISRNYDKPCILWKYSENLSLHYGIELHPSTVTMSDISHNFAVVRIGKPDDSTKKDEKVKDDIFEAINQVLKFVSYDSEKAQDNVRSRFEKGNKYPLIRIYYPVVVFDGNMYAGEFADDKIKLSEIKHVVVEYAFRPQYADAPKKFLLDIINKEYLVDFLKIIETECNMLKELVRINAPHLKIDAEKIIAEKGQKL